jgi:hypothetical protein
LSEVVLCDFTAWALAKRRLKPATVRSYLSSLSTIHELKGFKNVACMTVLVKKVIRGAENLSFYQNICVETRKVMTLPLLKLLGHEISLTNWSEINKQVFWTACVTAFFGSFRFGELLASTETTYNRSETLLWSEVRFSDETSVRLHVKISKNRTPGGEFIDLFQFKNHGCCPVKSLNRLKVLKNPVQDQPVFMFDSGKLLTAKCVNASLEGLLKPHLGDQATLIQGHSFRAAIPAAMANNPDLAAEEEIKSWGRWNSDSFKLYTRLKHNRRKVIFDRITSILNK